MSTLSMPLSAVASKKRVALCQVMGLRRALVLLVQMSVRMSGFGTRSTFQLVSSAGSNGVKCGRHTKLPELSITGSIWPGGMGRQK
jgi:hypothetical protein